jgi:hypothetical protein
MFPDFNNSMEGLARRKKIKSQPLNGKGEKRHLRTPNQTPDSCTKSPLITDVNVLKRQIIILCNYKCN